ncbi:MAG: hypothetical protein AAFN59_06650 [Pseudomonadota bacterium]
MNLPNVMMIALGAAALFEAAAYLRHHNLRRLLAVLAALVAALGAVLLWQPEPIVDRAVFGAAPSGGFSVLVAVGVMFLAICLGIAARYVFEAETGFDWFALLRPLVISPILLLPLIGTLDNGELQPLQLISLAVLSFQNGFFWQKVMANVKIADAPVQPVPPLRSQP